MDYITEAQLAELERLRKVAEDRPRSLGAQGRYSCALHNDFPAIIQELREAREMERFYGAKGNWVSGKSFIAEEGSVLEGIEVFPIAPISSDKGARARAYLAKIGEGE